MATAYYLCPLSTLLQVLQDSGQVLTNALIWTYAAGTSTPTTTWQDNGGVTPNSNPIQCNSAGRLPAEIWQQGGVPIKVQISTNSGTTLSPVFGVQVGPTMDNLSGINDPANILTNLVGVTGTFTATLTGCTTSPTVTIAYAILGGPSNGYVVCNVSSNGVAVNATSNSTSFGLSNWAVGLQGVTTAVQSPLFAAEDNSATGVSAYLTISAQGGGAPTFSINNSSGNWTSSGTKGIRSFSFSYVLK
jgi:hypothetical protein